MKLNSGLTRKLIICDSPWQLTAFKSKNVQLITNLSLGASQPESATCVRTRGSWPGSAEAPRVTTWASISSSGDYHPWLVGGWGGLRARMRPRIYRSASRTLKRDFTGAVLLVVLLTSCHPTPRPQGRGSKDSAVRLGSYLASSGLTLRPSRSSFSKGLPFLKAASGYHGPIPWVFHRRWLGDETRNGHTMCPVGEDKGAFRKGNAPLRTTAQQGKGHGGPKAHMPPQSLPGGERAGNRVCFPQGS